jgi:hypothetical protein
MAEKFCLPVAYVNQVGGNSAEDIIAQGYGEQTVRGVPRLVRIAKFKRKQATPVLKVTSRAFGAGWLMPIVRQE